MGNALTVADRVELLLHSAKIYEENGKPDKAADARMRAEALRDFHTKRRS